MLGVSLFAVLCALVLVSAIAEVSKVDPKSFEQTVQLSSRLWLVEFYSDMCGSCKEFAPTWARVEAAAQSLHTGKVNIDTKDGMALAQQLGVLNEGIPNIRLFSRKASQGVSIMAGEEASYKEIIHRIKTHTSGFSRDTDGYFQKEL